jgi:catechol 2,3-dioxygenase-like lactoylglutathione lyase family enzyme
MNKPHPTRGMHHVALNVENLAACEHFYVSLLGMQVEWRPDDKSLYLSSGSDNLALHQSAIPLNGTQHLNHIGFIIESPAHVNEWYQFLLENQVRMKTEPRQHRDGAYSFYCFDPDGNTVQMIYHPPLVPAAATS